jgi:YVTN family beta-propeller protein
MSTLAVTTTTPNPTPTTTSTVPPTTTLVAPDGKTSDQRTLELVNTITNEDLQPKSIVHSGNGLFFAQNMMYRHNVSVFDRDGLLVGTIPDAVDLNKFGVAIEGRGATVKGSPVEVAFTSDGAFAYVSNYKMYGDGWNPVADDVCQGRNWDPSFVYRIHVATLTIDQVIPVGAVPKYLAVTPDNRRLVVANWCSLDTSIIDTGLINTRPINTRLPSNKPTELARVDVGLHPRGIAITKDSATAYVAVMGGAKIVAIDLADFSTRDLTSVGQTPRHLVLSPDDAVLYATTNKVGTVRAIDPATDTVLATVRTGEQTRSMDISDDGTSLYVVNYASNTLTKVRTSDMTVVQTIPTGARPVGVTYDPAARRVWVANYTGSLSTYADQ